MTGAILIFILSLMGAFVLRVCGFGFGVFLTPAVGYAYLYGIFAVAIGTWIGSKVFHRLSTDVVKKLAYAYIAISGVLSLIL